MQTLSVTRLSRSARVAFDRPKSGANAALRRRNQLDHENEKIFKKVEDLALTAIPGTLCCSSRDTAVRQPPDVLPLWLIGEPIVRKQFDGWFVPALDEIENVDL